MTNLLFICTTQHMPQNRVSDIIMQNNTNDVLLVPNLFEGRGLMRGIHKL